MVILYVVLIGLVTLFTVYEAIGYYREYISTRKKRDMVKFIIKILVLVVLVILLMQLINGTIVLSEGISQ